MTNQPKKRRLVKKVKEKKIIIKPDGTLIIVKDTTEYYVQEDEDENSQDSGEDPQSLSENPYSASSSSTATAGVSNNDSEASLEGFSLDTGNGRDDGPALASGDADHRVTLYQAKMVPSERITSTAEDIASIYSLPQMTFLNIFSFLSLDDLFHTVRCVCLEFRKHCMTDPRWLPVIAPPRLANEVLELPKHWRDLCITYYKYWEWYQSWSEDYDKWMHGDDDAERRLLSRRSCLDGFFSLAPWSHRSTSMSYPTPWLHIMVYGSQCPTKEGNSTSTMQSQKEVPPNAPSIFFQQRVRSDDEFRFRTFRSVPVDPHVVHRGKIRRAILQPVNLRRFTNGQKHRRLPDHSEADLNCLNGACKKILECYFGGESVTVRPIIEHRANLTLARMSGRWGSCRYDKQGAMDENGRPVRQVSADSLYGIPMCDCDEYGHNDSDSGHAATIFVIAPHMYPESCHFDWCYATPLDAEFQYTEPVPWAFSTFKLFEFEDDMKSLQCQYTSGILRILLLQLEMMDNCENKNCVLQNADSVFESKESTCLIPCPMCIRKLYLGGTIQDIPAFLNRLSSVLQHEPFVSCCQNELALLANCY